MEFCSSPRLRCSRKVGRSGYNHEQSIIREVGKESIPNHKPSQSSPETGLLPRVFLLSPANTSAIRAKFLLSRDSKFELAQRFRREGAPLEDFFSFISSLYFRGKIAYANKFSNPPGCLPPHLVMTTSRGLLPPETIVKVDDLKEMSKVPVDPKDLRYREGLCRDARALARALPIGSKVVLLGSIASPKYVQLLLEFFGADLLFPQDFVGRGDMSRGGLMLRCVQAGSELEYVPVVSTIRRGVRPPKLSPATRDC
jgi:hypothetical protein